jgi:DNA-binding response OmpR family regulator
MTARRQSTPARLLIVDNDAKYGEWLRHHIGVLCPEATVSVLDLVQFERWCDMLTGRDCDVLILGAPFGSSPEDPKARGLELLRLLRGRAIFPAVIALAEEGNELTAVRALQLGAVDYLPKRLLTPERLNTAIRLALRRLERRVQRRLANLAHVTESSPAEESTNEQPRPELEARSAAKKSPVSGKQDTAAELLRALERADAWGATVAGVTTIAGITTIAGATTVAGATPVASIPTSEATTPTTPAPAGEFIPGYSIRMKIGESEKAAVYLARSHAAGQDVALKVSKTSRDETASRQFLEREYTAITAIRDPAVVRIHDYGIHAGFEYLAMEYFPRGDLKARMQNGVTELEALRYVEQIATALQVVHHAGLLHRDLKPPNVMLRENDDVALIDFGLARALDGSTPSTRTGVLRGSPYYMSPEQALGEQLDARSDFYSLGVMLYEMLTGRKPYTGGTAMDVLQQHVNAPVPRLPLSLARNEPLLAKLMAKNRNERFTRAEEVIAAVAGLREALAPAA